jgi:uncharacterized NAD(P)/FAD-binding protein YdhS
MNSQRLYQPTTNPSSEAKHVFIIIGAGLSGMAVFCQLVEKLQNAPGNTYKIKIIEKNPQYFATGEPYHLDTPTIWTLNNSAAKMKLTSNGQDAAGWMQENKSEWEDKFSNIDMDYVPRALIGIYLKAQYNLYAEKARSCGVIVEVIYDSVVDLSATDSAAFEIKTEKSQTHHADTLFLCLGHVPSNKYAHLRGCKNYFTSTTPAHEFKRIPKNEDIYFIGAQASFVDRALLLFYKQDHAGKMHTLTRNTSIITTKGNSDECEKKPLEEMSQVLKSTTPNSLSLAESRVLFWNTYCKSVKHPIHFATPPKTKNVLTYQLAKYDGAQLPNDKIINVDQTRSFFLDLYMGGCYQKLWEALREEDKDEFVMQFFTTIMAYLTGITPLNARLLLELYNREMIIEHSGLSEIVYDENKNKFIIIFINKQTLEANYIINTSGYGYDVSNANSQIPLIRKLIHDGLMVPKRFGGIEITKQGQLITRDKEILDNVFVIAPFAFYNHKYPTTYASFIAVEAAKNAVEAVALAPSLRIKTRL